MSYVIRRVAIIGSGTMGGALAALYANAGADVSLLDIVPTTLTADEEKKKLSLDHPAVRNRIVNAGMQAGLEIQTRGALYSHKSPNASASETWKTILIWSHKRTASSKPLSKIWRRNAR